MAEYKILDRLGDGSCGVVYRALQVELHREVALKMIRSGLWQAGETHERFSREIRACVELAHPNIVKVFDAGVMEGQLFIAMELIQGMTLLDMRCESGPVAIPRAAHLIGQAADALAHVHERGLVHRDVKPANLMADRSGHVTLMDFGLVKMLDATLLTGEGATIGTPRYLAPEGFDSRDVSPAQDVWALALTMHELIIGKPWIEGPVPRLLAAILGKEPITLRTEAPHAPESLLELQARALERDPKRRLTATQYRDGLGEIADRSAPASRCARGGPEPRRGPSPPRRPGPMQPVRAGAEPRTRRSFWPVAASLSLVLFGLALGIRSRVVVPVASPSPATGFEPRLQRPWFPGHRSLATRFAHPPPPGTAVELVAAGRTLARTAPDSDGAVRYDDLEPALAAGLRVVIPGQGSPGGLFPGTTPSAAGKTGTGWVAGSRPRAMPGSGTSSWGSGRPPTTDSTSSRRAVGPAWPN
ncbi:MAG: serine/threonine protein kinase [Candidatus Riflebacteria bacterium]|nr:serine/threonine protein kinase [Candidatus Riflebacteria bacterium]